MENKKKIPNINTSPVKKAYPIRDELAALAMKSCDKLGGVAYINDRYVFLDTSKFKVSAK